MPLRNSDLVDDVLGGLVRREAKTYPSTEVGLYRATHAALANCVLLMRPAVMLTVLHGSRASCCVATDPRTHGVPPCESEQSSTCTRRGALHT